MREIPRKHTHTHQGTQLKSERAGRTEKTKWTETAPRE